VRAGYTAVRPHKETTVTSNQGLSSGEIHRIVNNYIGVSGGYLGDFTYRGLEEFYPVYCDLEINPRDYSRGTTRQKFIAVLEASPADVQAKILRGLVQKLPQPTAKGPHVMAASDVLRLADRLDGLAVQSPRLANPREVVERALQDAETLIESRDAISAVDRLHTALHGYLRGLCDDARIVHDSDASAARLLRLLNDNHPALAGTTGNPEEVRKILTSMGTAVSSLGTLRNTASLAHPNQTLVGPAEAMLAVNATRTILHYLDAKLALPQP